MKRRNLIVVRGQRADFRLNGAGNLITDPNNWQPVARGEDDWVNAWQVTLAPVTQFGKGSMLEGMPAWQTAPTGAGAISCRLTFGGGGVGFQFHFPWPVNGASFAVSGDNVTIEARPLDGASVFTPITKPSVLGWLKPDADPTSRDPLVIWNAIANNTDLPIEPFTRALLVGHRTAGANAVVTFKSVLTTLAVIEIPTGAGLQRIPIPVGAETYAVNYSDGAPAYSGRELAFT